MKIRRLLSRLYRIAGFALLPMLGIVSPLLALPAVTSSYGAAGWSAVAIGQSIGAAAAVVIELGWGLTGAQRVARQSPSAARRTLSLSIATKTIVMLPLIGASAVIAALLANEHRDIALLTAAGTALTGLSCTWFYIGRGQLSRIFILDALPRLLAIASAAFWILSGGPLWIYPVLGMILPQVLSFSLVVMIEKLRGGPFLGFTPKRIVRAIKLQGNALAARLLSALYIALPVAIISVVSPQSVPLFAAIERLQRMTLQVLAAVPNMMQKWVGQASTMPARYIRVKRSVLFNIIFALAASGIYVIIVPVAASIIFSDVVQVPVTLSVLSGILVLVVCTSRSTGSIALVAFRKINVIKWSAAFGSVVGVAALATLGSSMGTFGALLAEILAELAVLTVQLLGILAFRRSMRNEINSNPTAAIEARTPYA